MMASGSSVRGLSEVTTTKSASSAATLPIIGRLVRSRSPPQPNRATVRPLAKPLHGAKNILQTIRRVGVVDQDRVVLFPGVGDHFHPPLHMGNCSQHPGALFQRNAQSQSRTQHIQRIIYHKPAGNANFDGRAAILCHRIEGDVVRRKGDMLRPQVCRGVLCIEVLPTCGVLQQPLCPGIVGVADAHVASSGTGWPWRRSRLPWSCGNPGGPGSGW